MEGQMLKIFYRILLKHRYISILNISGLAVGMAAFLLILHYVRFEYSFDKFHSESDRIFRLIMTREVDEEVISISRDTYPAMARAIAENYPGIDGIEKVMYNSRGGILTKFRYDDKEKLRDDLKTLFASTAFFDVFDLRLTLGEYRRLDEPFTVLISDRLAKNIYGDRNPVGELIQEDDGRDYEVVGVFKRWDQNSHLDFDVVKSFNSIGARHNVDFHQTSWDWPRMKTYIKLEQGVDVTEFERNISQVVNQNKPIRGSASVDETISLQPVDEIRLESDFESVGTFNQAKTKVIIFLLIGFVILGMSWVNFVNLTIAKGLDRIKESGVRKVLGASRGYIVRQHFVESIGVNFLAFLFALSLYQLLLPSLHRFASIPTAYAEDLTIYIWMIAGVLFGSLISGFYPAILLSRINMLVALKKRISNLGAGLNTIRNGLTSVQFAVSLMLLIIISVVYQQLSHLKSIDAGTRIEGVYVVREPRAFDYDTFSANPDVIKEEWRRIPGVSQVASSYAVPGGRIADYGIREFGKPESANVNIHEHTVDYDFIDLYELEFVEGRNFSRELATDDNAAVINLSAMRALGFGSPAEAIGKRVTSPEEEYIRHIIGVVEDYHHQSAEYPRQPILIALDTESRGYYSLALSTDNLKSTLAAIEETFNEVFPGNIYKSFFLDDYYNRQFEKEERLGKLLTGFGLLTVILALTGLASITYFAVVRRAKEISIRKVLGAGWSNLLSLFTRHGNWAYIIAAIISIPVSYYLIISWLNGFESRIRLSLFDFSIPFFLLYLAGFSAIVIVLKKSMSSNPVNSLREE